jgi:hypothetical protein
MSVDFCGFHSRGISSRSVRTWCGGAFFVVAFFFLSEEESGTLVREPDAAPPSSGLAAS